MSQSPPQDPDSATAVPAISPAIAMKLAVRVNNGDEAVAVGNRAGVIEWTNAAWTRITGWALDRCVDKPVIRLLDEIGIDHEVVDFVALNYLAGRHCELELPIETPAGLRRWIHLEVEPCRDEQGEISDFVAVARDISERRRAELALERFLADGSSGASGRVSPPTGAELAGGKPCEPGLAGLAVEAIEAGRALGPLAEQLGELAHAGSGEIQHELAALARQIGNLGVRLCDLAQRPAASACALDVSELVAACCRAHVPGLHPQHQLDAALIEGLPLIGVNGGRLADVVSELLRLAATNIGDAWGTLSVTTGRTEPGHPLLSEVFHRGFLGSLHDDAVRVFIELHDTGQALTPAESARLRRGLLPAPAGARLLALLCARERIAELGGELHVCSVLGAGTRILVLFPTLDAEAA